MINCPTEKREAKQRTPDLGSGLAINCGTLTSIQLIFPIRNQYTWLLFIILVDLLKLKLCHLWLRGHQNHIRSLQEH